ncbi:hypothetical protein PALA57_06228 [Pseudomonas aeruginosa]|nr:hypothetical protein [Pseudomonas aeruginosa]
MSSKLYICMGLPWRVDSGMVAGGLWVNGEMAPPPEAPHWNLGFARAQLEAAELLPVAGGEGWEVLHFADVGALAWYLLNLPWVFPGFSFRRHRKGLRGLHESGEPLVVRQFLFWLEARNPQAARG